MNIYSIKAIDFIVFLGILFFPFQNIALSVASSQYDITSFIYLSLVFFFTFRGNSIKKKSLLVIVIFILIELAVFIIFHHAPFYRLFSGLVWLGGLILLLLTGNELKFDYQIAFKLIICLLSLSAIYIIFEKIVLGGDRPKAFFGEPSYAGLCLYSASAGLFALLLTNKLDRKTMTFCVFSFLLIFLGGIVTFSMHIITFIITVFFLLISKLSIKSLPIIILFFGCIGIGFFYMLSIPHYYSRLNLANPESNISLLSWLEGFDQMKHTIQHSPFVGYGLGATGYFPFNSIYTKALAVQKVYSVNLTDAYSGAFRLIVEIGLIPVLGFLIYLRFKFKAFKKHQFYIKQNESKIFHPEIFLFIFAFSMIIGFLIKEPSYARSYVYLAFLLLGCIPLKHKVQHKV